MPLNLSANDAEFTPFLKYNAKAGRFFARFEGSSDDVEIVNPVLAVDMANIKTGWIYFREGSGPEKVWDPSPSQMAPKPPGPQPWKRGFEVTVIGNTVIASSGQKLGLRELSSTASNAITAIVRMYAEYEAGIIANRGKVPVYACRGVKPIEGKHATNFEPQFELIGWVERFKVAAFDDHLGRPNGHAQPREHVITDRGGYKLSETRPRDPIEEVTGARDPNDQEIPF